MKKKGVWQLTFLQERDAVLVGQRGILESQDLTAILLCNNPNTEHKQLAINSQTPGIVFSEINIIFSEWAINFSCVSSRNQVGLWWVLYTSWHDWGPNSSSHTHLCLAASLDFCISAFFRILLWGSVSQHHSKSWMQNNNWLPWPAVIFLSDFFSVFSFFAHARIQLWRR